MNEDKVMNVLNGFIEQNQQINDYTIKHGFLEDKETFYLYAYHKSGNNEDNIYWHCENPKRYTERELGLIAASAITSIASYKELIKVGTE